MKEIIKSLQIIRNEINVILRYVSKIEMDNINPDREVAQQPVKTKDLFETVKDKDDIKLRVAKYWNVMAKQVDLPLVNTLTNERMRRLSVATKDVTDIEEWKSILRQVPRSDFRLGHNDRNWIANFDWLFRNSNYIKMLEESKRDL